MFALPESVVGSKNTWPNFGSRGVSARVSRRTGTTYAQRSREMARASARQAIERRARARARAARRG